RAVPAPPQNVASLPAPSAGSRIETRPLTPPVAVAAAPTYYGAASPASYRPSERYAEITGSSASVPPPSNHWTWNGGSAVTVGYGETVDRISRRPCRPRSAV